MNRLFRIAAVVGFCFIGQLASLAQVHVRIRLDETQFLRFEPVMGDLVVRNVSGRALELQPDDFQFRVRFDQNRPVARLGPVPVKNPIMLAAGQTVTNRINFSQSFRIRDQGPYTIGGTLTFLGRVVNMAYAYTDVVPGITVGELKTLAGSGASASLRNLRLISNYRDKTQHLFLWIEDPSRGLSYGVYDLGPLLSVGNRGLRWGRTVKFMCSTAPHRPNIFTPSSP